MRFSFCLILAMSNKHKEVAKDEDWDEEALTSSPVFTSDPKNKVPEVFRPSLRQVLGEFLGDLGELTNCQNSQDKFQRTKEAIEASFSRLVITIEDQRPKNTAAGVSSSNPITPSSTSIVGPGVSQRRGRGRGQIRVSGNQIIRGQATPDDLTEVTCQPPPLRRPSTPAPSTTPMTNPVDWCQNLIGARRGTQQDEGRVDTDSEEGWEPITTKPRTPPPGCSSDDEW